MIQLLGPDGLRGPGAQISYLLPFPWYAAVIVEYLHLSDQPSATAELEQFFEISDTWSLLIGLSSATLQREADPLTMVLPSREYLLGADVYLKWKPTNVTETYAWAALTAEYTMKRTADDANWQGAGYAQIVAQIARRWRLGARFDMVGYPDTQNNQEMDVSASLAFLPSEFSRIRLTYAHDHGISAGVPENDFVILQLEGAIGAHGAHPF
jgi:hypothetical protein